LSASWNRNKIKTHSLYKLDALEWSQVKFQIECMPVWPCIKEHHHSTSHHHQPYGLNNVATITPNHTYYHLSVQQRLPVHATNCRRIKYEVSLHSTSHSPPAPCAAAAVFAVNAAASAPSNRSTILPPCLNTTWPLLLVQDTLLNNYRVSSWAPRLLAVPGLASLVFC